MTAMIPSAWLEGDFAPVLRDALAREERDT